MILTLSRIGCLLFLFRRYCISSRWCESLVLITAWLKRRLTHIIVAYLEAREVTCSAATARLLLHGDAPALSCLHHSRFGILPLLLICRHWLLLDYLSSSSARRIDIKVWQVAVQNCLGKRLSGHRLQSKVPWLQRCYRSRWVFSMILVSHTRARRWRGTTIALTALPIHCLWLLLGWTHLLDKVLYLLLPLSQELLLCLLFLLLDAQVPRLAPFLC